MPRFAANLTTMYNEHGFLDRFEAAARDGFRAVEFLFPYEYSATELKACLKSNALTPVLFTAPSGDWARGERGLASLPGRADDFKRSIDVALEYGTMLGNDKLHVMAGLITPEQDRTHHREVFLENLAYGAQQLAAHDITLLIEPINTHHIPGFFLNRQEEAQAICAEVGAENLRVQFDLYHCQIVEGDLAAKLKRDMVRPKAGIGHIQIAGVPERHEPDVGEINYQYLFKLIDELDYDGWIGCEYRPKAGTSEGLDWLKPWLTL